MAAKHLDDLDYYALLKVPRDADVDAIKRAFHAFARKYHPDRVAHDPKAAARNTRIYQRGTEAYRVLTQPQQRRLYDEGLSQGHLRFDPELERSRRSTAAPPGARAGSAARARPFLVKARQAITIGDYRGARLHLKIALGHDPDDRDLQALMREVEAKLAP